MSHKAFEAYFDSIEQRLDTLQNADTESFNTTFLSPERANLRLRIRFDSKHLLAVSEALAIFGKRVSQIDYRYHLQDEHNQLIFRYDSTRHFPDIETFPHHKHLPTTVVPTEKPDFFCVLEEAIALLSSEDR